MTEEAGKIATAEAIFKYPLCQFILDNSNLNEEAAEIMAGEIISEVQGKCTNDSLKYSALKRLQCFPTSEERQVIASLRRIGWGEVTVKVKDGKIVLVSENKTIKVG
jgi:hypothetical protein